MSESFTAKLWASEGITGVLILFRCLAHTSIEDGLLARREQGLRAGDSVQGSQGLQRNGWDGDQEVRASGMSFDIPPNQGCLRLVAGPPARRHGSFSLLPQAFGAVLIG